LFEGHARAGNLPYYLAEKNSLPSFDLPETTPLSDPLVHTKKITAHHTYMIHKNNLKTDLLTFSLFMIQHHHILLKNMVHQQIDSKTVDASANLQHCR